MAFGAKSRRPAAVRYVADGASRWKRLWSRPVGSWPAAVLCLSLITADGARLTDTAAQLPLPLRSGWSDVQSTKCWLTVAVCVPADSPVGRCAAHVGPLVTCERDLSASSRAAPICSQRASDCLSLSHPSAPPNYDDSDDASNQLQAFIDSFVRPRLSVCLSLPSYLSAC